MKKRRLRLRFFLDEGVPVMTGEALEAAGHQVIYFKESGVAKGSSDQIVCVVAEMNDAILVAHDGDMKTLAKGHGITPARFKTLNLLRVCPRIHERRANRRVSSMMEAA